MKKTRTLKKGAIRALSLALSVLCLFGWSALSVGASGYQFPDGAVPVRVTLDGKEVLDGEAVIIRSVTYVPLRSVAELAGAEDVSWDPKTSTATVTYKGTKIYVADGARTVEAAGRIFYTAEPVKNISNRLFVPIRPLAKSLSMDLWWDNDSRTVVLRSTGKTLLSAEKFYSQNDLYWLSRIISAEAAGESLEGQIAVGNVVLNRKAHPSYPSTVYGVIFDRVGGVQFSPVAMGTIYKTPTASSVRAAKICLEGYSISENILFFMNPRIATNNWISKNRPFAFRIGNHDFYY